MKQKISTVCILSCIVAIFGIWYFKYNIDTYIKDTLFFDVIISFTAYFGVFAIIIQNQRSKNIEEAQFIFELNKEFINNEQYMKVLDLLNTNEDIILTKDEISMITRYCDFFEPLYILIKKGIVNLKIIDNLFCYRFFSVVNNKNVQRFVLTPQKKYFINIVKLHYIWKRYRLKKIYNNDIPLSITDLSLLPWYYELKIER